MVQDELCRATAWCTQHAGHKGRCKGPRGEPGRGTVGRKVRRLAREQRRPVGPFVRELLLSRLGVERLLGEAWRENKAQARGRRAR